MKLGVDRAPMKSAARDAEERVAAWEQRNGISMPEEFRNAVLVRLRIGLAAVPERPAILTGEETVEHRLMREREHAWDAKQRGADVSADLSALQRQRDLREEHASEERARVREVFRGRRAPPPPVPQGVVDVVLMLHKRGWKAARIGLRTGLPERVVTSIIIAAMRNEAPRNVLTTEDGELLGEPLTEDTPLVEAPVLADILGLDRRGLSQRAISRRLHISRGKVLRALNLARSTHG